jgi:hypothetical protein
MTAATLDVQVARPVGASDRLRQVALVRIAAGEGRASRAILAQDLAPLVPHRLPLAQWRAVIDREVERLRADGFVIEAGAHLAVSDAGSASVRRFLAVKGTLPRGWQELRDVRLIAKALGLERLAAKDLKLLARPDGLRAAVVQSAYQLKIKGIASPSRLRSALAALALQRAFGNQIKAAGLAGKGGLPAKAGRLLAGQLARAPRDFGTDTRLIAALAAEQIGGKQADVEALRRAVLCCFLDGAVANAKVAVRAPPRAAELQPVRPLGAAPPLVLAGRPDLQGFVAEVCRQAAALAHGWVGNRKAYISHVWRALEQVRSDWCLSEIEFKCMLVEAHRAGQLALANADLKDHKSIKDVQESAVVYKNAVFHYIRVDG